MFEVVFTSEPRESRGPLHYTYEQALSYIEGNRDSADKGYEVWQVADDINRTRVLCVLSAGR